MNTLQNIAYSCKNYLSDDWKAKYGTFLQNEHLSLLARNVSALYENDVEKFHGKPNFEEEIIPDIKEAFSIFKEQFRVFKKYYFEENHLTRKAFATALEKTSFANILILSGQRLTSASMQDENAIPPLRHDLLKHSFELHNAQISKAVRAWEKHAQRSSESFWGTVKGNAEDKEVKVKKLIEHILKHKTWWNVFTHYKHDLVYEIRIPSGHGIRWKKENLELIGFLEPFEEYDYGRK
ncbi:hypothetical protein IMCC3317_23990 [Kordia antarctica]|uniref:Uncharacterized protein n=1 Tax=Kordia antarctica TaxID=1218801 RepID=A0A7L4ZKN2_9FLAO|nr:hypothetical protein [Kordia antarctica]QHI37027.1 hypothetical protein IMCC3317_23990 [Kordia antarctica]